MNYEEFKEKIKEDLGSALEAQDIRANISERHVEKLNSSYDALSVTPEGSNIGVNANLSSMFDAIENGQDYSEVLEMSVNKIAEGIKNAPNVDVQDLTNYEVMKNKLSMDVVSADRNAEISEGN